jgi:hypothetical protein
LRFTAIGGPLPLTGLGGRLLLVVGLFTRYATFALAGFGVPGDRSQSGLCSLPAYRAAAAPPGRSSPS